MSENNPAEKCKFALLNGNVYYPVMELTTQLAGDYWRNGVIDMRLRVALAG